MAQKIVQGNEALASKIKFRRNELGLTIEEPPYPLPQAVIYCWTRSRRT